MIAGLLHEGSGLGDQLFRYITVRTLAEKKALDWGMILHGQSLQELQSFKGEFFLEQPNLTTYSGATPRHFFTEKDVRENGVDIRSFDPEFAFVGDNTIIDGSFEDDKYWRHNLDNISKWLAVGTLNVPDDLCVIGFRGGEYATQPDLFLTKDYYKEAVDKMRSINPQMRFEVHTDDPELATKFFSSESWALKGWFTVVKNKPISHSKHINMGFNWRSARYAKYAIIPNSAFFILPRILKHHEDPTAVTIAPRYWARRNTKTWARPACYYPEFTYI